METQAVLRQCVYVVFGYDSQILVDLRNVDQRSSLRRVLGPHSDALNPSENCSISTLRQPSGNCLRPSWCNVHTHQ